MQVVRWRSSGGTSFILSPLGYFSAKQCVFSESSELSGSTGDFPLQIALPGVPRRCGQFCLNFQAGLLVKTETHSGPSILNVRLFDWTAAFEILSNVDIYARDALLFAGARYTPDIIYFII